jgi:hypothetical protein
MGETLARVLVQPLAASCQSFNETCLDDCEFDSSCSDCWKLHLTTHPSAVRHDEEVSAEEKGT